MFLQTFDMGKRAVLIAALLSLAACSSEPDNTALAEAEANAGAAAAAEGRISCAMGGATLFDRKCTMDRMTSSDGPILIVGREGQGYRRLLVTTDGRGVVSADGAEPALVTIIDKAMIEVAVGGDRFRLPADASGGR
jgi:hypothetical protein